MTARICSPSDIGELPETCNPPSAHCSSTLSAPALLPYCGPPYGKPDANLHPTGDAKAKQCSASVVAQSKPLFAV